MKALKGGKVLLEEAENAQYLLVEKELSKLCKLTDEVWGFLTIPYFNQICTKYFVKGMLTGAAVLAIVGGAVYLYKKKEDSEK